LGILIQKFFASLRHLCFAAVFKVTVMVRLCCANGSTDHTTRGESHHIGEAASFSGAKNSVIIYSHPCDRRQL